MIRFNACEYVCVDNTSLSYFFYVNTYGHFIYFNDCVFRGAGYAIYTTGRGCVHNLEIFNCEFDGVYNCVRFDRDTVSRNISQGFCFIGNNVKYTSNNPLYFKNTIITWFDISTNCINDYVGTAIYVDATAPLYLGTITGNTTIGGGTDFYFRTMYRVTFSGNTFKALYFYNAIQECTISGNLSSDNWYIIVQAAGEYFKNCTITGNTIYGRLDFYGRSGATNISDVIVSGNYISQNFKIQRPSSNVIVVGNIMQSLGGITLGTDATDTQTNIKIISNNITGDLTFTAPTSTGVTIMGNTITGTTTTITGSNYFCANAGLDTNTGATALIQTGSRFVGITTVNAASANIAATDHVVHVTYTATAACALQLMTAQLVSGRTIKIKDAGGLAGTNNIVISTEGSETIDGAATYTINTNYDFVCLYSDGSNWFSV